MRSELISGNRSWAYVTSPASCPHGQFIDPSHDRRRIIHFEVTQNPTQIWLARQMTEAFPWDTAPRYLLRDRDASYGQTFRNRVAAMAIKETMTTRAPSATSPNTP